MVVSALVAIFKLLKCACKAPDIKESIFAAHAKLFVIIFLFSFFLSKPSGLMNDLGKQLWALTSYIVFVLVHLYLRLLGSVLPCEFHQHWRFLYIARCHFIV